jgi:hypothetical protein
MIRAGHLSSAGVSRQQKITEAGYPHFPKVVSGGLQGLCGKMGHAMFGIGFGQARPLGLKIGHYPRKSTSQVAKYADWDAQVRSLKLATSGSVRRIGDAA